MKLRNKFANSGVPAVLIFSGILLWLSYWLDGDTRVYFIGSMLLLGFSFSRIVEWYKGNGEITSEELRVTGNGRYDLSVKVSTIDNLKYDNGRIVLKGNGYSYTLPDHFMSEDEFELVTKKLKNPYGSD